MNGWTETAAQTRAGSRWPAVTAVICLATALAGFGYAERQKSEARKYLEQVGMERLRVQRLTLQAARVANGEGLERVGDLVDTAGEFERGLQRLRQGDLAEGLPPAPPALEARLANLERFWQKKFGRPSEVVRKHGGTIARLPERVRAVNERVPRLAALSDEAATLMAARGMPSEQVYVATRQLHLCERIVRNVNRLLKGGEGAVTAGDRFMRDAALFGRVNEGLLQGNPDQRIQRVADAEVREKLEAIKSEFSAMQESVVAILEATPEQFMVNHAARDMLEQSGALAVETADLEGLYIAYMGSRWHGTAAGFLFGLAAMVLLAVAGLQRRGGGALTPAGQPSGAWSDWTSNKPHV